MKLEIFEKHAAKLLSQRNAALVTAGLVALSNVILVGAYVIKGERTILVPPQITKPMWVGGGEVSAEYLEEMALFFSTMLLDMSPASAHYKHEILLKYTTPENFGALKKQFVKDAEEYQSLQLSTTFKPIEVFANPETLEVSVKGDLSSYIASGKVSSDIKTLYLKFSLRGAGLLLEQVKGADPHAE